MRLIARFAQEQENYFNIITVYDKKIIKENVEKEMPQLISISKKYPSAVWFEQKISDDFGIEILESSTNAILVKHEHFPKEIFPMRKKFSKLSLVHHREEEKQNNHKEVILGPTHSYSLESSQLKLVDNGTKIVNFKLMPFYKYRGIEKMVEGLSLEDARSMIERISAPQTIAYQSAWLDIQLQASQKILPDIIKKRHLFLLELERINNHLHDLSILCKLVDFQEGASFFVKFLESGRMVMKSVTGHRYGFGAISLERSSSNMTEAYEFLLTLEKELLIFEKWIEKRDEILAKMLLLGQLSKEEVALYGLVGLMARSSNIQLDRREGDKFYKEHNFYLNREEGGDVFSRFNLRINEIFTSLRVMRNLVKHNTIQFFLGRVRDGEYYSFIESSAGELMMYVSLKNGLINRFYVRDPSFLNAQVLPLAVKNSKIEQLGIVIKSIPLNISAIDL